MPAGELRRRSWRAALEEPLEAGVSHAGTRFVAPRGGLEQVSGLRLGSCRNWRVALEGLA